MCTSAATWTVLMNYCPIMQLLYRENIVVIAVGCNDVVSCQRFAASITVVCNVANPSFLFPVTKGARRHDLRESQLFLSLRKRNGVVRPRMSDALLHG